MRNALTRADFTIVATTDLLVVITDDDQGNISVTNDASNVVSRVDAAVGGLGKRRLYYKDSAGEIDELTHQDGHFTGFKSCTPDQREHLKRIGAIC